MRLARCSRQLVAGAMAALLLFAGQVVASASGGAAQRGGGGVLTVGLDISGDATPVEFDPQQFTSPVQGFAYNWPIYAGLLRETPSGAYVPDLASSVKIPDPSTLNITLRPGLVFSNGSPLNAAAVKAGLTRNLANPHPSALNAAMTDIDAITVTSPKQLAIHFSQPVASTFYPLLADTESFIALPTGASSGNPNENLVGAGPFMLKSFTSGSKIVLVKNPRYWNAKSIKLSGITFVNVEGGPTQINALEGGTVDAETNLPVADLATIKSQSSMFQINSSFVDANYLYTPICKASGPLAKLNVRRALSYAVNRVGINKALLQSAGQPAWSIFPSTSAFYDRSLTNYYPYNPKKAKQLLAAAGYPNGFSTTLIAFPEPSTNQLATVLQSEWKAIGVKVQLVPTSSYVSDLESNKAQMGLNPQGLPGINKLTTYMPGGAGNLCNYNSPTLNALIAKIQSLPPNSPSLRQAWVQAQDFVIKNALSVYVDFSPLVTGAKRSVKNLQVIPYVGGIINYWAVSVSG